VKCTRPLHGWRTKNPNENGKYPIVFDHKHGQADDPIVAPCGKCLPCRLNCSTDRAIRSVHEASQHEQNSFHTYTYNDENLPKNKSIDPQEMRKFIQRYRYYLGPDIPIKYSIIGEYGKQTWRAHYHGLIFGHQFDDLEEYSVNHQGDIQYKSETLNKIWGKGDCIVGELTKQSAGYVARHNISKIKGEAAAEHYKIVDPETGEIFPVLPEFHICTTQPGIGKIWYDKYKTDLIKGYITDGKGNKQPVSRYYEKLLQKEDDQSLWEHYQENKKAHSDPDSFENHGIRLRVKEEIAERRAKKLERNQI